MSFDDYPVADLCEAGLDAGMNLRTSVDPALRGCDAGPPPEPGAAGASDGE